MLNVASIRGAHARLQAQDCFPGATGVLRAGGVGRAQTAAPRRARAPPEHAAAGRRRGPRRRRRAPPPPRAAWDPPLLADVPGRDYVCAVAAAAAAKAWVDLFKGLAARGALDQKLSRKLVHATSGPLFLLTWPLFRWAPGVSSV
jgi:hypothetical protein